MMTEYYYNSEKTDDYNPYNEAYIATITINKSLISEKFNSPIIYGYDDLDEFEAMDFKLPNSFGFQLFRYRPQPNNEMMIFFQSRLKNWEEIMQQIFVFLEVKKENIVHVTNDYFNTP